MFCDCYILYTVSWELPQPRPTTLGSRDTCANWFPILPALVLQFLHPLHRRLETFLEASPPPLAVQPLALPSRTFMKLLQPRQMLDPVPPDLEIKQFQGLVHSHVVGEMYGAASGGTRAQWRLLLAGRVMLLHEVIRLHGDDLGDIKCIGGGVVREGAVGLLVPESRCKAGWGWRRWCLCGRGKGWLGRVLGNR